MEEAINDAPPHVKDVTELIQELIQTASTRESTKRALFSIPFQIGSGLEIGIQGYVLVTEEKRKAYTWFDPNTRGGEEVQVVTEFAIMVCSPAVLRTPAADLRAHRTLPTRWKRARSSSTTRSAM